MKLPIINNAIANNFKGFVDSWSKLYSFSNEPIYRASISKKTLTKTDIQNLYEWKNGMRLSVQKQKSLDTKIITKLTIINKLKNNDVLDIKVFKKEFINLSAVWKIFLLHIIKPTKYPIYDQHIHRTFLFIHKEDWLNISNTSINNKAKEQFYFERYLPLIASQNIKDIKKLDEAFFAFGQFLNTRNYASLLQ
ncbi:hypothetical protein P8625_04985 [Tenacibaculum tangerinum]|uniref:Uncharacterized protein n=1 Tax=Tenacibaculum tangerinum TaxID=3038772 RepID=A0ABY8L5Z6_9FLAO|nr:hypothetical protein [Tenacibaculum tangerinum]WGH76516.1 hypothetical protein P8625_04985 [Tenacibaculum tangerinum]